jgi:hypothetical protein
LVENMSVTRHGIENKHIFFQFAMQQCIKTFTLPGKNGVYLVGIQVPELHGVERIVAGSGNGRAESLVSFLAVLVYK